MAKPELGTKRHCPSCGTRYYDLNRDPVLCPKCGTVFDVVTVSSVRPERVAKVVVEEDVETEDAADVDLVPLEEADAEAGGTEVPDVEDEEIGDIGPEIGDDDDEDVFLEEEDEGDDVTGIIREVGDEEER
ncbi:TIGR02300 family protein [Segnochrobactraceae bacterium EtOH-i3]